jgi:hypothetical protein
MDENGITSSTTTDSGTSAKNEWDTYDVTTKSDKEVAEAVDELWDMFDNWQLGNAQCAAWIQKYYLPMLWISLPNLSSLENKKKLVNTEKGYVPKRWDLIILNSKSAPKNWHIGIVLSVSKDGYIEYMDWNGSLDANGNWTEKVAINSISWESAKIIWFRNVNKGYEDGDTKTSYNWKDSDYEAFESFLDFSDDWPSDAERKTIAKTYWFWDNLNWMYNFANEQLKNRKTTSWETTASTSTSSWRVTITWDDWKPITYADWVAKDDTRLNMPWFDPILWFNPVYAKIYKWIADGSIKDVEEAAKNIWITEEQLRSEVRNYWLNSIQWWARNEESSYSSSLLDLFAKLYNEAANSKWEIDFRPFRDWNRNTYRNLIYKQIKSAMTLEKMVEARSQNIWFWQVTEWEWRMLREAAAALWNSFWTDDDTIRQEVKDILKALWHDVYWQNNDWTVEKWNEYRAKYGWTEVDDYSNDATKKKLWIDK